MPSIYLVHWNIDEAKERAGRLQKLGYDVTFEKPSPTVFREIRKQAPDLFLIDLSRLPSQGRDVALNLRQSKSTRFVPIIFVDGDAAKIKGIKKHLPDATYTTWDDLKRALRNALANPLKNPVVPGSVFDGYADAPLVKKLGIKKNSLVALIEPPLGFKNLLVNLPDGVKFVTKVSGKCDLAIWFVMMREAYQKRIETTIGMLGDNSGLWVVWPKRASKVKSDLTQNIVRQAGLKTGLVDYKICSIDETWSGLKFRKRKSK